MMPIAGALYDKIGAKAIAVIGMLITAYALYLTSQLSMETSHGTIVFWMCLRAAGMGLMMMPMQTAGMSTVPMDKVGQGTALSNTIRQVSGAFGIAWLSMLFTDRRNFHSASYAEQLNMFSTSVTDQINRLQNSFVALGQSASQARASALSYVAGQVQIEATITALDDVFILTAALSLVALALSLLIKEKKRKGEPGMPMMGE